MIQTTFNFKSKDGMMIHVYKWSPKEHVKLKGVFQLVHGSVEHALRYKAFAEHLVSEGFVVYANDHRGHGKTAGEVKNLSYFSDLDDGFNIAVDDLNTLNSKIRMENDNLKVFILGHSLGSFMLRKYVTQYPKSMDGMILTGTGGGQNLLLNFGLAIAARDLKRKGRRHPSEKLHKLMYGPLNNNVKNKKSEVDFISRDQNIIDAYNADPYCGHTVTTEYALESLKGIKFCSLKKSFDLTPNDVPIYILSGQQDLVGGKNAKEVKKVAKRYQSSGAEDLELKIYKDARHEILNEINKNEVYGDIVNWVKQHLN